MSFQGNLQNNHKITFSVKNAFAKPINKQQIYHYRKLTSISDSID
jgi:hypothetical protein